MNRAQRAKEAREKEAAVIQLRSQGVRNKDIAAQYGINEARATAIWQSGLRRIGEPVIALERSRALEVRDLALRKLWTKEQNPPPSRVIQHKDGSVETTFDPDYHTRVMGEIRKWEEHSARLLGLYESIKVTVNNVQVGGLTEPTAIALRRVLFEDLGLTQTQAEPQHQDVIEVEATAVPIKPASVSASARIDDILNGQ